MSSSQTQPDNHQDNQGLGDSTNLADSEKVGVAVPNTTHTITFIEGAPQPTHFIVTFMAYMNHKGWANEQINNEEDPMKYRVFGVPPSSQYPEREQHADIHAALLHCQQARELPRGEQWMITPETG